MSSDWFNELFIQEAKAALNGRSGGGSGGGATITKTAVVTTNWVGDTAPYIQTVSVAGVVSTDRPHVVPIYSATNSVATVEEDEWSKISDIEAGNGTITFECFKDKPTVAFNIQIELNR